MVFANKIECESHQLERPRPRVHTLALALTRTRNITQAQSNHLRQDTARAPRLLKGWKQARNVPPVLQITSKLTNSYTRITTRLAQRHRQEQQQEYHIGAIKPIGHGAAVV
jgi:hypothetical protein